MSSMTDLKLDYIEGVLGSDVLDKALPRQRVTRVNDLATSAAGGVI